jgi:hypothetical protein
MLAQTPGSRSMTLQRMALASSSITSTDVGVLFEAMQQSSHHITDLDLQRNSIGNGIASLLCRPFGNNALPKLKRLSLHYCGNVDHCVTIA